ncbi:MAG: hypothetical protein HY064_09120 [Bacteroidetes bacterium]|nr:hypothetical protein [Bacteroidota bacterium]
MKFFVKYFFLFIVTALFYSCYSLPLVKLRRSKTETYDSVFYQREVYFSYFNFSISRYGVLGRCSKHLVYDSAGKIVSKKIYRSSNCVSDGVSTDRTKTIYFGNGKKKTKIERDKTRDLGWGGTKKRIEKIISYDSAGKKIVQKKNWNKPKTRKSDKATEKVTF